MEIVTNKHNGQTYETGLIADTSRGMVAAMAQARDFCTRFLSCTQPFVGLVSDIDSMLDRIARDDMDSDAWQAWSELQEEIADEIGARLAALNPRLDLVVQWCGERGGLFIDVDETD